MDHPIAYVDIIPPPVRDGAFIVGLFCLYKGSQANRPLHVASDEEMWIDALAAMDVDQQFVICIPLRSLPSGLTQRSVFVNVWEWLYPLKRFPLRPLEAVLMPYLFSDQLARVGQGDLCLPLPLLPYFLDVLGFGEYVEWATDIAIHALDSVMTDNSRKVSGIVTERMLDTYARQLTVNLRRWRKEGERELLSLEADLGQENAALAAQVEEERSEMMRRRRRERGKEADTGPGSLCDPILLDDDDDDDDDE